MLSKDPATHEAIDRFVQLYFSIMDEFEERCELSAWDAGPVAAPPGLDSLARSLQELDDWAREELATNGVIGPGSDYAEFLGRIGRVEYAADRASKGEYSAKLDQVRVHYRDELVANPEKAAALMKRAKLLRGEPLGGPDEGDDPAGALTQQ